jgi:hypothetical protein
LGFLQFYYSASLTGNAVAIGDKAVDLGGKLVAKSVKLIVFYTVLWSAMKK